jgi:hypothetical protein
MNFLERLANEARKKRDQIASGFTSGRQVQTITSDVQQKIATAKYGVLANNPQRQQQFTQSVQPGPIDRGRVVRDVIQNRATGLGLGATRSIVGTAQGVSGLTDLLSPGVGTNRVSKGLDRFAKTIDQTAEREGVGNIYKVGQVGTDLLSFAAPSAAAKGISKVPRVAKAFSPLSRGVNATNRVLDRTAANVAARGPAGRVTAQSVRAMAPANVTNMAVNTGLDLGAQSGKGEDISKRDVALSVGLNAGLGIGLPVATRAGIEAGKTVNANIPRSFYRGAPNNEPVSFVTQNKGMAKEFARDTGGTGTKYGVKPKEIFDLSNPDHAYKAEKLVGKQKLAELQSHTPSGKFSPDDEKAARLIAKRAGFKAVKFDEREVGKNAPKTIAKKPESVGIIDESVFVNPLGRQQAGSIRVGSGGRGPSRPLAALDAAVAKANGNSVSYTPSLPPTAPTAPPIKPPQTRIATAADPQLPAPRTQTQLAPNGNNVAQAPPTALTIPKTGKQTRYASKTVPESEFVSEQVRKDVKAGAPVYDVQTEKARYTDSLGRLKEQGDELFEQNLQLRLQAPSGKISSQDVADGQALAAILDARGDTTSLQKATDIYEKLSEHLTAAGQTVQAAAILSRRTPEGLRYWATKQLNQAGITQTPELQAQLQKLVNATRTAKNKDRAVFEVQKLVNDNIPSGLGDRIINAWRAGLLTAPTTTGGNILGNTGEALVRKGFVNPVATAADAAMGLFTGKRTQTLARPGAAISGVKEGTKTLPDYLKTGYDPRNSAKKYEQNRELSYGNGKFGKAFGGYVNGVYRLMGVADAPFSTAAEKEALSSIAKAEALNRGLKGDGARKFVDDFMQEPPKAALERAKNEADYATFKNKTALGTLISRGKQGLEQGGYPGTKAAVDFVVPFTQVPSAVATRLVQRTPIGIATEVVKQIKAVRAGEPFDQRAMSQAIGNGTFGPVAMGAGYALAQAGQLTFGYPTDAKERKLWEAEGKQPYSVRIGDRWYSLNYLQPFGMLMAIGGQAYKDVSEGKNATQVVTNAVATGGQAIQEQSFLKGINGVLTAISDPERSAEKLIENTAGSIVPNFLGATTRAFDPVQRSTDSILQGVMSDIPGLRDNLPTKNDMFGNPLPAKDNPANQLLNPFKPSIARDGDPLTAELRRLKEGDLGQIPSQIKSNTFGDEAKLDDSQLRELQARVGQNVGKAWNQLVTSDKYKSLSDEDKAKALKGLSGDVLAVEKQKYAAERQVGPYAPNYAGKQSKLSTAQTAIANGNLDVNTYARPEGSQNSVNIQGDKRGTDLLDKVGTMNKDQLKEWEDQDFDGSYNDMYDRALKIRPEGLPDLPKNNRTLAAYADYLKIKNDKPSNLKLNNAKKDFLKQAYQSDLSDNAKELFGSYSNQEKLMALANGDISQDDFERAMTYDNFLLNTGLASSAKISNALRREFGYADAPRIASTSRSGGSGGKGRAKLTPADFKLPTDILTKYATRGANLARTARLG